MDAAQARTDQPAEDDHMGEQAHVEHGHGHHHGHHHEHHHHHEKPMTPEEVVGSLLVLGQVAINARDYESAAEAFASVLKLEPNEVALYNLGSFRARGLGVPQDYVEAARLFHQAELLGNERAGMLCAKCMFDYVYENIANKTPADLYASMAVFVSCVYPEATNPRQEVKRGLAAIANTLLVRDEHAEASKVLRAAAEFGDDDVASGSE